jgi:predicted peptidase
MFSQNEIGSFKTKIETTYHYNYILNKPILSKEKKPLIVFLHGSGERGEDVEKVKVHGPLKYIQNHDLDAFILAPQCPENEMWESESLYKLIEKIISENPIDPNRIYLIGLSMGGWGTWNLAFAHPETFAAVVPICGFVDRVPMLDSCILKNTPIRIFHGLLDDVVNVNESIEIYKRLKKCNNDIELTIFDDANHDSWTRVYDSPDIYNWMLLQSKK